MQYPNNDQYMYAHGGHVGLREAAERIRHQGQEGDTVLAHINPMEAKFLDHHFGGDINPHTGLPQYGRFWKKLMHIAAPVTYFFSKEGSHSPFVRKVAPVVGSVIGGMAGPIGSVLGGAIANAAVGGHRHMLDHALGGALVGLGHATLSPMLGSGLGLDPASMGGKMMMTGHPGLGNALGLGSLFGGASGSAPAIGGSAGRGAAMHGLSNIGGGAAASGFGLKDAMQMALLGTAITGSIKGKEKKFPYGSPENESLEQFKAKNRTWGPEDAYHPAEPMNKNQPQFRPPGYRGTVWNFFPTPEEQQEQLARANAEMAQPGYAQRFARGGQVKGYWNGAEGGQADTIPIDLPENSYVMDATTVSLAGDGNSGNGARKIRHMVEKKVKETYRNGNFERSGITKELKPSRRIKAMVSDGELNLEPHEVSALGDGDFRKGVKVADKFRKNLRRHKGVKTFLPPKSKELTSYLR